MGTNLVFEIGTEELPSSTIIEGIGNLKLILEEKLRASFLEFESCETYGTPRRLAALIFNLAPVQGSRERG